MAVNILYKRKKDIYRERERSIYYSDTRGIKRKRLLFLSKKEK